MLVVMLRSVSTAAGSFRRGRVYELDDRHASAWCGSKIAEPAPEGVGAGDVVELGVRPADPLPGRRPAGPPRTSGAPGDRKLRILADLEGYTPRHLTGAPITVATWLREMVKRGHEARALAPPARGVSGERDGVAVEATRDAGRRLAAYRWADVAITHLGAREQAARMAHQSGTPLVQEFPNHHLPQGMRPDAAATVIVCAEWILGEIGHFTGPVVAIAPTIFPDEYRTTPGERITLVNLYEQKGAPLFWELAERMPDREFLGVRGAYGPQDVRDLPNVEVVGPVEDMKAIYAQTRILLMPSRYESYGRTAVEAACSGIPTIASPTPGLREALGRSGTFVPVDKRDRWEAAIRQLDDPEAYAAAGAMALERVAELDPAGDMDRLERLLIEAAARPAPPQPERPANRVLARRASEHREMTEAHEAHADLEILGGGWYGLPDGRKIQGKQAALEALWKM